MKREHIIFSGQVQGVGFRYWSTHYAGIYNLTGWVKNLFSGDVEMAIQGKKENIEILISKLKEQRFIRIENIKRTEIPLLKERKFEVKYQ